MAFCPGLTRWAGARKVKPDWIYWSKRQWVAVASAGPYATLHLAPVWYPCLYFHRDRSNQLGDRGWSEKNFHTQTDRHHSLGYHSRVTYRNVSKYRASCQSNDNNRQRHWLTKLIAILQRPQYANHWTNMSPTRTHYAAGRPTGAMRMCHTQQMPSCTEYQWCSQPAGSNWPSTVSRGQHDKKNNFSPIKGHC